MMGVRRLMWNWQRRRISIIFEYVRIVGAVFFWYTLCQEGAALCEVVYGKCQPGRRD